MRHVRVEVARDSQRRVHVAVRLHLILSNKFVKFQERFLIVKKTRKNTFFYMPQIDLITRS